MRSLMAMVAALVACSSPGKVHTDASCSACTPGASQACACTNGSAGAQVCADDGCRFEECVCSSSSDANAGDGMDTPDPEGGGGAQFEPDEVPGNGGSGDSFRPTVAVTLGCGWLPQYPPGSWDNNACGPVSLEMGVACVQWTPAPTASDTLTLLRWMNTNAAGSVAEAQVLQQQGMRHISPSDHSSGCDAES